MVVTLGCVEYYPGWVDDADRLFGVLQNQIVWEQHALTFYGRTVPTPRLTAWIGDSAYRYSGIVNEPAPWPAALAELRGATSPGPRCRPQLLFGQSLSGRR
jgi:alkylated DNA repair dioxygenase AlkB